MGTCRRWYRCYARLARQSVCVLFHPQQQTVSPSSLGFTARSPVVSRWPSRSDVAFVRSECIDCVNVTALASRCHCLRLRPFTGMYIFSSAECHFSKSISRRPQPGGSEVCHHAHHVHLPSCFCHWWIRFCGGPIIRRYNRTGLHTSGEGRTRKVCTGGEFAAKGYVWQM